jgi:Fe-S-cluster containining protein
MLVPLSAPEAFALREYVDQQPSNRRTHLLNRLSDTKDRLRRAGLWDQLSDVAEAQRLVTDDELDPINQAYYALRIACPYLENEMCSIYEARPAACRELLVTSPAELCQDLARNPVTPLPVAMRMSSILGLLWGTLTSSPPRLIPLPTALEWAERHEEDSRRTWPGSSLLDQVLDNMWRFLSQAFTNKHGASGKGP